MDMFLSLIWKVFLSLLLLAFGFLLIGSGACLVIGVFQTASAPSSISEFGYIYAWAGIICVISFFICRACARAADLTSDATTSHSSKQKEQL